ncbi:hypothetical protein ACFTAO_24875 [Paenibacillus rhizoplanae]
MAGEIFAQVLPLFSVMYIRSSLRVTPQASPAEAFSSRKSVSRV